MIASTKSWAEANKDKVSKARNRWAMNNPESKKTSSDRRIRRKQANGDRLSKGLTKKLFALQKGKCACCGESLGEKFHLDHIVPLAKGGRHIDSNIQLLRAFCNIRKSSKDPIEYMQSKGYLL